MKLFLVMSVLLCTCTLVQSRLAYNDFVETAKEYLHDIVISLDNDDSGISVEAKDKRQEKYNKITYSDSEGEQEASDSNSDYDNLFDVFDEDEDKDIDMGDGTFIGIRSFHDIEKRGWRKKAARKAQEAEEARQKAEEDRIAERDFTDQDGDYIKHDCLNIKEYTQENWEAEEWNKGTSRKQFRQYKGDRHYVKYSSAYGIPMIGTVFNNFTDESMLRGCYLLRYIFADNQHLRIATRRSGMFNLGYRGGRCCMPQMGNQGLSCQCHSKFPRSGKGAPAHEMAHYFYRFLGPMVEDGRLILPEYVNQEDKWAFRPEMPESAGSKKSNKSAREYSEVYTWIWNAQKNDKMRYRTGIDSLLKSELKSKTHHYLLYGAQQNWLFKGNDKVIETSRPCFKKKSINLYNLMEKIWPCNNIYTPVCKDAAYGFKWGLSQKMKIGKSRDPTNISKMTCEDIDNTLVKRADLPKLPTDQPTEDGADKEKCMNIARFVDSKLLQEGQGRSFKVNEWAKYLRNDHEYPWYLRRCCASSMNFDNAIPQNEKDDPDFKYEDVTCRNALFDEDDEKTINEEDYEGLAEEEEVVSLVVKDEEEDVQGGERDEE